MVIFGLFSFLKHDVNNSFKVITLHLSFYVVSHMIFNRFLDVHQLRNDLELNEKQTGKLYDYIKWQYRVALCEYIRPDLNQMEMYNALFYTSWESDLLNLKWHFPSIFYLFHIHCQFSIHCRNQWDLDLLTVVSKRQ